MKAVLVLSVLLCAALAAPAEDKAKAPEAAVEAPKEEVVAAAPEMEEKMMTKDKEVFVPEDAVPVPMNARVLEEETDPESRFNFCPRDWEVVGSRCVLIVHKPVSWYSAQETCHNMGGHLASITNSKEDSSFQKMLRKYNQDTVWMGGFNLQGKWMWIDNEGFHYSNWRSLSSSSKSLCMYLTTSGWVNTSCYYGFPFICSMNPFN